MSMVNPAPTPDRTPAQELADNIDALHANGYGNLDIPTQVAIASSQNPRVVQLAIADQIKQATVNNASVLDHFFADPQQSRIPSLVQQATTAITSHFGHKIVAEPHVSNIQQDLIKAGVSPKGAQPNGVWGPEWVAAAQNAKYAQLTAPGTGNLDSKSTVEHLLGASMESRALNAIIETVKSTPRSVLQLIGDAVHGAIPNSAASAIAQFGAKPENRLSAQEWEKKSMTFGQAFNDAMTLLTFLPMARAAQGLKAAGVEAKAGEVLSADAVKPKYTLLNSIVAAHNAGLKGIASISEKALLNKPVLKQLYWGVAKAINLIEPAIAKTAPAQVLVRDNFAQRLRLPAVRAANKAGLTILGAGIQEQAIAGAESKLGAKDSALTSTVYGVAPISGALANALDIFSMQMNPSTLTTQAAKAADIIGSSAKATASLRNALDDMGALVAWQKANPQIDLPSVIAAHKASVVGGTERDVLVTIGQQVNEIATQQAMSEIKNGLLRDGTWAKMDANAKEQWGLDTRKEIYADAGNPNGLLAQARQSLVADQNALETGFRQIGAWAGSDVRAAAKARKAASRFGEQVHANSIMSNLVKPELSQYFITPDLLTSITNEAKAAAPVEAVAPVARGTAEEISAAQKTLDATTQAEAVAKAKAAKAGIKVEGVYKPITKTDIKKKLFTEEQLAAQQEWNAATRANREARQALNKLQPKAPSDFIVPTAEMAEKVGATGNPGQIGIANFDTLTKQTAEKLYNSLVKELKAVKTPEERDALRTKIANTLINEFGLNVYELGGSNVSELLSVLRKEGDKLASDLYHVRNAPEEFTNYIAKLKELGYKPVIGTDIGHAFNPAAQYTDLGTIEMKAAAKVASRFGLSPRLSDSAAVSARALVETNRTVQEAIDSGKIKVFPSFNADRLLTYIRSAAEKEVELTWGQKQVLENSLSAGLYDVPIKKIIEAAAAENRVVTRPQAWAQIKEAKRTELGLREIPYKQLMDILTKPLDADVAEMMGLDKGTKFMDQQSAMNTIQAIWKARTKVPTEMIGGIAKVEDFLYAGIGIGGKVGGTTGMKLAAVPSELFNLRSRVRYQLSPLFAYRRMFKTAAKGITENIPPTMYPEAKMDEMGITAEAQKIHARVFPEDAAKNAFLDEAERVIKETDFYNLYNTKASEEWASYWLAKQGFSDAEIAKKIENVMGYGERTAAERSVNAIFFPFSFNKTVMRQFGAYFLTHPGQVVLTHAIMDFYDKHNGPKLTKWLEDNHPLIKELSKLNPLEHGVGLGGIGGINAPYFQAVFDLLSPKVVDYGSQDQNNAYMQTLKKYIPAIKEFSDLFMNTKGQIGEGEVLASVKGLVNIGEDIKTKFTGGETLISPRQHANMPEAAQQTAAWAYRNTLITQLQPYLDYNYKNPSNKIVWPNTVKTEVGIAGKSINKNTIGQLVHYKYPKWSNTVASSIAAQQQTEADRFIGEIKKRDPQRGANYQVFQTAAQRVSDAIAKDSIPEANMVKITDGFRKVAIDLAQKDPSFAAFYKTHYERIFGPLEGFK